MMTLRKYCQRILSGMLLPLFMSMLYYSPAIAQGAGQTNALHAFAASVNDCLEGFSSSDNLHGYTYTSLQENAKEALITRTTNGKMDIDWYTAPVPGAYDRNKGVRFLFLVDKDMHHSNNFDVYIDGQQQFSFGMQRLASWSDTSADGGILRFITFERDNNGDARGYMTLYAPPSWLHPGKPLHIRIAGRAENSNAWFMVFKTTDASAHLQAETAYDGRFKVEGEQTGDGVTVTVEAPESYRDIPLTLQLGSERQSVKGQPADSFAFYKTIFENIPDSSQRVLHVLRGNDTLFTTSPLFRQSEPRYTVAAKGLVIRDTPVSRPDKWEQSIRLQYLPSFAGSLIALTDHPHPAPLYLLSSSHQDIAWMDSPAKCELFRDTLVITPLLKQMEQDATCHFDIEDVLMIREYVQRHPDRKQLIQHFLDDGQLNVGGAFNMPYEDMYGGETLVREFYQGARWLHKTFGYHATTYWNVDVPGRTLQMPQLLAKSGIRMMVISRMGKGLFNWMAPDGSRVLTYSPGHYGDLFFAFQNKQNSYGGLNYLAQYIRDMEKQATNKDTGNIALPLLWDMDMVASGGTQQLKNDWNRIAAPLPEIYSANSPEVYAAIRKDQDELPRITGERPDVWLYIHGPSHERALHASRDADILLPAAEKFATMNALLKGSFRDYPSDALAAAWEAKIYPDHGWGGKNGEITDHFFLEKFLFAKTEGRHILNDALQQIASGIKFKATRERRVVVFNSLSFQRSAPVTAILKFDRGEARGVEMTDAGGNEVPCQLSDLQYYADHSLQSATLNFVAAGVPSIGYRTYYARMLKQVNVKTEETKEAANGQVFESDAYRIRLASGGLQSIFDKSLGKELLNTQKFIGGEIFTMHSEGNGAGEFADIQQPDMEGFDKTSLHAPRWKIVADGPVFTELQFRCPLRFADAQLSVILYKHLKRIDLKVNILNWEGVLYREFRMALPLKMDPASVAYAVPFGILRVGQDELHRPAGERYTTDCRLVHPRGIASWIGASHAGESVTLSSDVAVADYEDPTDNPAGYTILQPVLIASRRSCHQEGNEYLQTGDHYFSFSLTSGPDGYPQQNRQGVGNHVPLFVVTDPPASTREILPQDYSFMQVSSPDVLVSAVKKAEDADKVCIRMVNISGTPQQVTLHCFKNLSGVMQTNLIEEPLHPVTGNGTNPLSLQLGKYAIETYIAGIKK